MGSKQKTVPGGLVVIFEGVDGVGKTTQLELVRKALVDEGWAVHATRNLGGTPLGEELRKVAFSSHDRTPETDLYISAAIQAELAESIESEYKQGKIVLIDRGPLSFAAYHIYGNGVAAALGWQFADEGIKRFRPDLVILYKMDVEVALERAKRRKGSTDYYASKPKAYFERVNQGYGIAAKRYAQKVTNFDASQSVEAVHTQTMLAVRKALAQKTDPKHKH